MAEGKKPVKMIKANKVAFMEYFSVIDGERKMKELANKLKAKKGRVIEFAEGSGKDFWTDFYDKDNNEYMEAGK